jgi:subtilisin family serine protease
LAVEGGITYTRAPEVWSQGYTGQGIVAAGADTGYRWDHTALRDHYRGWNGASANHDYNWHDSIHSGGGSCGANSPQPCDDNGHGTHTMGTMVGDDGAGNQVGMAPGAKWIGCRNMDQGVGTPATYIECFEFFLAPYPVGGTPAQGDPAKAPHVTNNSWGCPPSEGCSASTLQAAVEAQRAAGIVTVVAAGNAGPNCSSVNDPPAIYDASYSIGAFNHGTGTIASFSSRGPVTLDGSNRLKPDISAPGVGIRSSTRTSTTSYGTSSGTSMAAPHTTGAVALLLSAKPALGGQVDEIEGYLNDTAVQVSTTSCSSSGSPNNVYGAGRLDVKTAVDLALTTISPVDEWYPETGGEGTVQVSAPAGTGWSATSNASWIDISSASAGVGNGIVVYAVRDNLTGSPRQGTITIARKTFTVTQDGGVMSDCLYVITPTSQAFNAGGGTGVVTVFAEERCSWSARSNATWITVTSGCCGIGNGSISYSVGANGSSKPRKGTITIAGRTFSIKQKGTP